MPVDFDTARFPGVIVRQCGTFIVALDTWIMVVKARPKTPLPEVVLLRLNSSASYLVETVVPMKHSGAAPYPKAQLRSSQHCFWDS